MTDSNRSAFVTGANRGLGLEICRQLGQKGYKIFLGCRDIEKGQEATRNLMTLGISEVTPIQLDATDSGSIIMAVEAISNTVNCLDVLVNNAGTFEEEWGTMPSACLLYTSPSPRDS